MGMKFDFSLRTETEGIREQCLYEHCH